MVAQLTSQKLVEYWNPNEVADSLKLLRKWNVNVTQWEPMISTVQFPVVAGPIIEANSIRTAFLDKLGESTNGGLPLTNADFTFGSGKVPNGQVILLQSFGISVCGNGAAGGSLTAADVEQLVELISVRMNLRQRPLDMGAVADWPSIEGVTSVANNGFQVVGEVGFDPIILEPLDDFSVTLKTENVLSMSNIANVPRLRIKIGTTRFYTERVLGLS